MYQLQPGLSTEVAAGIIKRLADNAFIPFDPANTDYQAYLKYVEDGGEVLPADGPAQSE